MPSFKGEYRGLKFSIELYSGSKNSPDYLKISIFKSSSFRLSVYRESFLSNLGKKLGIVHEVKTNDEIFDKEFLIFSNEPNQTLTYFRNDNIKGIIRQIFNNGFNAIVVDGKKILVQKPNYILEDKISADYKLESDLRPSKIIDILQKLSFLARGL